MKCFLAFLLLGCNIVVVWVQLDENVYKNLSILAYLYDLCMIFLLLILVG